MKEEQQEIIQDESGQSGAGRLRQYGDTDGTDILDVLRQLRAGINTIMTVAGLSLCLALVFILLTRNQVTESRTLELPGLPVQVWLQCQGDMRCRTEMLSSWLSARAPAGVNVSVTQSFISLTMRGPREAATARSAVINGYLSQLQQEWDARQQRWQQAVDSACVGSMKASELCAGVVLLLAQSQTGSVITATPAEQRTRWPPGMVVMLSVLAGFLAGAGVVVLQTAWQAERERRGFVHQRTGSRYED